MSIQFSFSIIKRSLSCFVFFCTSDCNEVNSPAELVEVPCPCSLVKEIEITRLSSEEADKIMEDLMTLAQNTAVRLVSQMFGFYFSFNISVVC